MLIFAFIACIFATIIITVITCTYKRTMVVHSDELLTGYWLVTWVLPLIGYLITQSTLQQMYMHTCVYLWYLLHITLSFLLLLTNQKRNKITYVQYLLMNMLDTTLVHLWNVVCNCLYSLISLSFMLLMLFTLLTTVTSPFLCLLG